MPIEEESVVAQYLFARWIDSERRVERGLRLFGLSTRREYVGEIAPYPKLIRIELERLFERGNRFGGPSREVMLDSDLVVRLPVVWVLFDLFESELRVELRFIVVSDRETLRRESVVVYQKVGLFQ